MSCPTLGRWPAAARGTDGEQPVAPHERNDAIDAACRTAAQRTVGALEGSSGRARPQSQRANGHVQLGEAPSSARSSGGRPRTVVDRAFERARALEVDGPPVVGIDEAEIPQLGALVQVGHAGGGALQDELLRHGERVRRHGRDQSHEGVQLGGEHLVGEAPATKASSAAS